MSLVETLKLLSRARQYVEQGEECVLRQRAIVELLELRGATRWTPFYSSKHLKKCKTPTSLTWDVGIADDLINPKFAKVVIPDEKSR